MNVTASDPSLPNYLGRVERDGGRKPLVARFGGIPLNPQTTSVLVDRNPSMFTANGNELIGRLVAGACELP